MEKQDIDNIIIEENENVLYTSQNESDSQIEAVINPQNPIEVQEEQKVQ